MLNEKERGIVAGFRQWAEALRDDDNDRLREIERDWYNDSSKYQWSTKQERDDLIIELWQGGARRNRIAYDLQIPVYLVNQAIQRVRGKDDVQVL